MIQINRAIPLEAASPAADGPKIRPPHLPQAPPRGRLVFLPLARLAGRLALPVALFGAAFIPSPNGGLFEEGEVPGQPGLRYSLDNDTGTLRLTYDGDPDPTHALVARLGTGGIYSDVASGVPVARATGGNVVILDLDRAPVSADGAAQEDDQPKLCPDPGPDRAGGRKLFDEMYEQYVRDTVNPQRQPQLPPGLTFALPNPESSNWVYFDDCRESDGAMIEAKGNYADLIAQDFGQESLAKDWLKQAGAQIKASQGRRIEWYFHDASAADFARGLFGDEGYDQSIGIHVLPYPGGVPKPNPRIK